MPPQIRPATPADIPAMSTLLTEDARTRSLANPTLWPLAAGATDRIAADLTRTLNATQPPFRQQWLIAESGGALLGLTHTILLPVPPIYAGEWGAPRLIMTDCALAASAAPDTAPALLAAAEADLRDAGARLLLAATTPGSPWEALHEANGYSPLTLYFASTGLTEHAPPAARKAVAGDLPGIVALSARNRRVLAALDPFWKPHPEADARFSAWMTRSLTLTDRDMLVTGQGALTGYAIAQPAGPLHFPPAHDISATGFLDDWFHLGFGDPARRDADDGTALLAAAEAALAARGDTAALVVCPAAWRSKIEVLEAAGYEVALTWRILRPAGASPSP